MEEASELTLSRVPFPEKAEAALEMLSPDEKQFKQPS
jgi:hypothetical protein